MEGSKNLSQPLEEVNQTSEGDSSIPTPDVNKECQDETPAANEDAEKQGDEDEDWNIDWKNSDYVRRVVGFDRIIEC